ncbi:unnamed protein product [Prunus armeniaca]|uniref:Uncharacterized protein n=1 Tax=Prunus armeniaca TaxID=36596 RepID=A0A6J5XML6_PRUAR|nr:unnamed protein product [Prunus armeniaca]
MSAKMSYVSPPTSPPNPPIRFVTGPPVPFYPLTKPHAPHPGPLRPTFPVAQLRILQRLPPLVSYQSTPIKSQPTTPPVPPYRFTNQAAMPYCPSSNILP